MSDIRKRKHTCRTPLPLQSPDFARHEIWNMPMTDELPLYPFCVEEIERSSRTWFSETLCRFMIVTIVTEGDIVYRFEEKEHLITPGKILIVPQNASYFFKNGPSGGYKKVVAEFMGKNLQSIMETLGLNRFLILEAGNCEFLAGEVRKIGELLQNQTREAIPELLGLCHRFLTELSMLAPQKEDSPGLLARAQMILESALDRKTPVQEVAAGLGIRVSTLNRLFQERLGVSPMRYRLESRIARAQYLLGNTSLSVKEIAYKLGYCNQFYFSQEFRRITGMTPRESRRQKNQ